MDVIEPAPVKKKRIGNYKGRKPMFSPEEVKYIQDNPDQLNYSELARKFATTLVTIRKVVRKEGAYRVEV